MIHMIRIAAAATLIVGAGFVHGAWTNRWGPSPKLIALGSRFESVPMVLGDWNATAFELADDQRAMAGAVACLARRYTNPGRGTTVTVLLVGGLPGKISTHTPDVCYAGGGYSLDRPDSFDFRYGPEGQKQAGFRTFLAKRDGTDPSVLRIYWSWNASKGWKAPEEPRWAFGSASALCKLYVIRETAGAAVDSGGDPCNDFMRVFLPELDRLVFSEPL